MKTRRRSANGSPFPARVLDRLNERLFARCPIRAAVAGEFGIAKFRPALGKACAKIGHVDDGLLVRS
ncbi:MAG: hypothetical protein ACKVOP_04135 [Sphingomonadaceae bacterium]